MYNSEKKDENLFVSGSAAKPNVSGSIVANTYLFPNGMIATFGYDDEQIPELQGRFSAELKAKIKERSDDRTKWNGF